MPSWLWCTIPIIMMPRWLWSILTSDHHPTHPPPPHPNHAHPPYLHPHLLRWPQVEVVEHLFPPSPTPDTHTITQYWYFDSSTRSSSRIPSSHYFLSSLDCFTRWRTQWRDLSTATIVFTFPRIGQGFVDRCLLLMIHLQRLVNSCWKKNTHNWPRVCWSLLTVDDSFASVDN